MLDFSAYIIITIYFLVLFYLGFFFSKKQNVSIVESLIKELSIADYVKKTKAGILSGKSILIT